MSPFWASDGRMIGEKVGRGARIRPGAEASGKPALRLADLSKTE
jgi:hypothetical protein